MNVVALGDVIRPAGRRAGRDNSLPVYSVTKHAGFVPSLEYFNKQVFSRDLASYKLVEPGDFAYATIHLDEGSIGIAPERGLISPMYTVFQVDHSRVDPGYLIRFLKSPGALSQYSRLGQGAVHRRKAVSLAALGSIPIPLPSLDSQRRIAAILAGVDRIRDKRRRALKHLTSLADSIFVDMFGGHRFTRVRAGEIMPSMRNGLSPATGGGYSATVLMLSAITHGAFNPRAAKEASFAMEPPADKRVSQHDFLVCRGSGNRSLVGAGTYSQEDRPDLVFPDTVIAGRVDASRIDLAFLEVAWRQRDVRLQLEAGARTTNGTFKINQKVLSEVVFGLPPIESQRIFADRAARISEERKDIQLALELDDELFESLQSKMFLGEL